MKKEVGLWIDHRRAVMVINLDQEETIKQITSNMEKHVRYSSASHASGASESHNDTTEDGRDRRFDDQLNRYFDEVISDLRDATSILILGPGEAKVELQTRLAGHGLSDRIVAIHKETNVCTRRRFRIGVLWKHCCLHTLFLNLIQFIDSLKQRTFLYTTGLLLSVYSIKLCLFEIAMRIVRCESEYDVICLV